MPKAERTFKKVIFKFAIIKILSYLCNGKVKVILNVEGNNNNVI